MSKSIEPILKWIENRKITKQFSFVINLAVGCMIILSSVCTPSEVFAKQLLLSSQYYVGPNGSDSNPGTQSRPWKTIQKAANVMVGGDTVIVQAGSYAERVKVTRSGSAGLPITFQASGEVTMRGFTVIANYISIEGFEITNTPDNDTDGRGIYVEGSYCDLENNYIHYATRGGILLYVEPGNNAQTRNCTVKNNRLYRNSQNGIEVMGQDHLIEGNEIWGTIQNHPGWADRRTG